MAVLSHQPSIWTQRHTAVCCTLLLLFCLHGCWYGANFPKVVWPSKWSHERWPDSMATCLERQITIDTPKAGVINPEQPSVLIKDWQRYLIEQVDGPAEQAFRAISLPAEGPGAVINFVAQVSYPDGDQQTIRFGDLRPKRGQGGRPMRLEGLLPAIRPGAIVDIERELYHPSAQAMPPIVLADRFPILRLQCSWPSRGIGAMVGKIFGAQLANGSQPVLQDPKDPYSRWQVQLYDISPSFSPSASPWQLLQADRKTTHLQLRWIGEQANTPTAEQMWQRFSAIFATERKWPHKRQSRGGLPERIQDLRSKLPLCTADQQLGLEMTAAALDKKLAPQSLCSERHACFMALQALGGLSEQVALALLERPDGPPVDLSFPNLGAFSGMVLAVRETADEPWQWLDPFCPQCPLGTLPLLRGSNQAMLIQPDGVNWQALGTLHEQNRFEQQLRGMLTLTGMVDWSGQWQAHGSIVPWLRQLPQGSEKMESEQVLQISQIGAWPAVAPARLQVRNTSPGEGPDHWQATVTARYQLGNPTLSNTPFQLEQAHLWGEAAHESWLPKGSGPHLLFGPRTLHSELSLRLPPGLEKVILPEPVHFNHPAIYYEATWQVDSRLRQLTANRSLVLRTAFISQQEWAEGVAPLLQQIQQYEQTPIQFVMK